MAVTRADNVVTEEKVIKISYQHKMSEAAGHNRKYYIV